jgi:hypothetical protein
LHARQVRLLLPRRRRVDVFIERDVQDRLHDEQRLPEQHVREGRHVLVMAS